MNNNCHDIQHRQLIGSSDNDTDHLRVCADCSSFAAALTAASSATVVDCSPPAACDTLILQYAAQRRRPAAMPRAFAAALLALTAAIALGFFLVPAKSDKAAGPDPIAHVVTQVVPEKANLDLTTADPDLTVLLQQVADGGFSGDHLDAELLQLELQLATLQTDTF